MFSLARRTAALAVASLAGTVLFLGSAAPAAAADGSGGLLGSLLGDTSLITLFIGNYQINN